MDEMLFSVPLPFRSFVFFYSLPFFLGLRHILYLVSWRKATMNKFTALISSFDLTLFASARGVLGSEFCFSAWGHLVFSESKKSYHEQIHSSNLVLWSHSVSIWPRSSVIGCTSSCSAKTTVRLQIRFRQIWIIMYTVASIWPDSMLG